MSFELPDPQRDEDIILSEPAFVEDRPTERLVWNDETGEQRTITHGCKVCGVTDLTAWEIIVSPSGVAHLQHEDGFERMKCGANGAADGWWWPL